VEVTTLSQLPSINEAISRRRHSLFGHVRRMDQAAPAHQALHLSVTSRQGSGQFDTCRRQPGRPQKCWMEQVTTSTGLSLSDAWSVVTDRSAWRALQPMNGQLRSLSETFARRSFFSSSSGSCHGSDVMQKEIGHMCGSALVPVQRTPPLTDQHQGSCTHPNRDPAPCDLGRHTEPHTRPISCHVTSLPWQEPEEELNKLLLTNLTIGIKTLDLI